MKSLFKYALLLFLIILILPMFGCVDRFIGSETNPNTGDIISPEAIDSIFEAISASVVDKYPVETDSDGDIIVFWVEGGSVWHSSLQCGSISKADYDKLKSGSALDAIAEGKERACKVCSKGFETDGDDVDSVAADPVSDVSNELLDYPKEYDSNGKLIVYWLKNGNVWHESSQCGNVIKASADSVFTGTPYDAFLAGKTRACRICSADSHITIETHDVNVETVESTESVVKYPKKYDENGNLIVFWLESGTVWHESLNCSVLTGLSEDRIISGSVSEAIISKKERACKKCSE